MSKRPLTLSKVLKKVKIVKPKIFLFIFVLKKPIIMTTKQALQLFEQKKVRTIWDEG